MYLESPFEAVLVKINLPQNRSDSPNQGDPLVIANIRRISLHRRVLKNANLALKCEQTLSQRRLSSYESICSARGLTLLGKR